MAEVQATFKLSIEEAKKRIQSVAMEMRKLAGTAVRRPDMSGDPDPTRNRTEAARRWRKGSPWLTQGTGATPPPIPTESPKENLLQSILAGGLKSPLAIVTQFGASLAGARAAVGLFQSTIRAILGPFQKLHNAIMQSANAAAGTYAKSLVSGGLPVGFTGRKEMLAKVIGVGEQDVLRYGKAVEWLNEKIDFAARVHAQSARTLTTLNWESKVAALNFNMLKTTIAVELSPAITDLNRIFNTLASTMHYAVRASSKYYKLMASIATNALPSTPIMKILAMLGGQGDVPDTIASAKRLQTSSWERMGMVVGSGPALSWGERTATNTGRTVEEIRQLRSMMPRATSAPIYGTSNTQP